MVARQNVPGTISRAAWGARYPDGFANRPLPVREWWLHHSVTSAPDLLPPFDDDDAAIRLLEKIGQSRFGGGISYTMPITPIGRSYTGHSFWRRGAHTGGHNTIGAAICFVGNYETMEPTEAQLEEAARVMVAAHRLGIASRHTLNGGHRDLKATACPGRHAYAAIAEINRIANRLWAAGDDGTPAKSPAKPSAPKLVVDGKYGPATVKTMQRALGTPIDGIVSGQSARLIHQSPGLEKLGNWHYNAAAKGSPMVLADQRRLRRLGLYKGQLDGLVGPMYWKASQREQHTVVDGIVSWPSALVKAIQRDLNAGRIKP